MPSQKRLRQDVTLLAAFASGAAQAVLFNPFDRALFVRVQFRRKRFLDWRNFDKPFQGFANAASYRVLCGASYLYWQDLLAQCIRDVVPCRWGVAGDVTRGVVVGLMAGSLNGAALNSLQAIKFRMWSETQSAHFFLTARDMYRGGGIPIFFRGICSTVMRDAVFGIVYETLRRLFALLYPQHASPSAYSAPFVANMAAAAAASAISSPFNYVRTMVYGSSTTAKPLGVVKLLKYLAKECYFSYRIGEFDTVRKGQSFSHLVDALRGTNHKDVRAAVRHLNSRLNVGWGSLRVGAGMATGQLLFEWFKQLLTMS